MESLLNPGNTDNLAVFYSKKVTEYRFSEKAGIWVLR